MIEGGTGKSAKATTFQRFLHDRALSINTLFDRSLVVGERFDLLEGKLG